MAAGPGNFPFMTPNFVGGFFQTAFEQILDETPIFNEFLAYNGGKLPMYEGKVVTFDEVRRRKSLAKLQARPNATPGVGDSEQYGQVEMRALYTHEKNSIAPDALVLLRQAGMNPGQMPPGATRAAGDLARLATYIREHSMRTAELWCANLLQGGSFTQTVNEVSTSVDTGITAQNIGGNFATASVDIPYLLAKAARQHRAQAGANPDLIICADVQRENFAKNDKMRSFLDRQPASLGQLGEVPEGMRTSDYRGARWIYHISNYLDDNGASQNYWSNTKLTMVSLRPQTRTLLAGTHPIIRPDGTVNDQEAYTRHLWTDDETGDLYVREVAAMMFGLGDKSQVTVWNTNA